MATLWACARAQAQFVPADAGVRAVVEADAGIADASVAVATEVDAAAAVAEVAADAEAAEQAQPSEQPVTQRDGVIEVVARRSSAASVLRASAQSVKVIETAEARRHSADVSELLARSEGLSVQRMGGVGSETRLSLHGLTDESIRFFLDGVPLDFAGFGLGISHVPLNWLERIDVYRGVVPPRYGADALGGAIDLVTDSSSRGTSVVGAYTAGSFDTHQGVISARTRDADSGLLARAAAFYDSARNDYVVQVQVPDMLGRLGPAQVRRFHDRYRGGGASVEVGLVDRPLAKRLLLRVFATDFDQDLQHNINMTVPYGAVRYGQTAIGGTLRYELHPSTRPGFNLTLLGGYSHRSLDFRDRSRWVRDWFGQRVFERSETAGETSPFASDLRQWENRVLARLTLSYAFGYDHVLRLFGAPDVTLRDGEERERVNADRRDPQTSRRALVQLVSGLEYGFFGADDAVENSLFVKHYHYAPSADQVQTFDDSLREVATSRQSVGAGDALRVQLAAWLIAKASYEYATRLPRPDEVLGDGARVRPNLGLVPERSHNADLSALIELELGPELGRAQFEATGFMRRTREMILQLPTTDRVHAVHRNVIDVNTWGVDGMLRWDAPGDFVTLAGNATWFDQRNASRRGPFGAFEGRRVPNRPWLLANGSATLRVARLPHPGSTLTVSWFTRYSHAFEPSWDDGAVTDASSHVPGQVLHALSLGYAVQRAPIALDFALDVDNLTDARAYDVLGVQRPGRAVFFKVSAGFDDGGTCSACAR